MPPADGRCGRTSSGAGHLACDSDGHFCTASKGSNMSLGDHRVEVENLEENGPSSSSDELMTDGTSHPALPQFSAVGGPGNGGFEGTSLIAPVCEKNTLVNDVCMLNYTSVKLDNLSSSLLEFCMGTGNAQGSFSVASHFRLQGVWLNASSNLKQPFSRLPEAGYQTKEGKGLDTAWQRPKVIPMAPIAELEKFSEDGSTTILDEEEVHTTIKNFEIVIVGRLFGRRIPYPLLVNELKHRWGALGVFKFVTISGIVSYLLRFGGGA